MREINNYHIQHLFQKEEYNHTKKVETSKKNFEQILGEELNRIES